MKNSEIIFLNDNFYNNAKYNFPITKTPDHKKRKFLKTSTRLIFLSIIISIFYLVSHHPRWDEYNFSSKDMALIQYLCTNQSENTSSINSNNSNDVLKKPLSEHQQAEYLNIKDYTSDTIIPISVWDELPIKAAYYMVVTNENLVEARSSIRSMEDSMKNKKIKYPWIILNSQPFTPEFKKYIKKTTKSPVFFGLINPEVWEYPHWINVDEAEHSMFRQVMDSVYRGGSLYYHKLLRYQTAFFFRHPLFQDIQYSWRVEPGADFSCQLNDDMFMQMAEKNKVLGFVLTKHEAKKAIPSLWSYIEVYMDMFPGYILPRNESIFSWIYDNNLKTYNLCQFSTDFQIVDLSFFRSPAYQHFIEYLDRTGNFFYERWSDATIHTIAASLFLDKKKIHFFNNIGYSYGKKTHCPYNETLLSKCSCDVLTNYDLRKGSCTLQLLNLINKETLNHMLDFVESKDIKLDKKITQ